MVLCGYFSSISWGSYSDSLMWPSWRHRSDSLIRWVFRWYVGYTALQYLTWWVKKGSWEIVGKSLLDSLQLCNSQDFYRPFGVKIIAWSQVEESEDEVCRALSCDKRKRWSDEVSNRQKGNDLSGVWGIFEDDCWDYINSIQFDISYHWKIWL